MNDKIKMVLHGVVSLGSNVAVFALIPDPYRIYVMVAFNIVQVIYAWVDPTYTINLLKLGKINSDGKRL